MFAAGPLPTIIPRLGKSEHLIKSADACVVRSTVLPTYGPASYKTRQRLLLELLAERRCTTSGWFVSDAQTSFPYFRPGPHASGHEPQGIISSSGSGSLIRAGPTRVLSVFGWTNDRFNAGRIMLDAGGMRLGTATPA